MPKGPSAASWSGKVLPWQTKNIQERSGTLCDQMIPFIYGCFSRICQGTSMQRPKQPRTGEGAPNALLRNGSKLGCCICKYICQHAKITGTRTSFALRTEPFPKCGRHKGLEVASSPTPSLALMSCYKHALVSRVTLCAGSQETFLAGWEEASHDACMHACVFANAPACLRV